LKNHFSFDIIFIQELSWTTICSIQSLKSRKSEALVGVPNHSNRLTFASYISNTNDYLRIITYVNIRLLSFWFSLYKDIYNYRDISLIFFLINIYLDSSQSALKYLKNTEVNIHNILIMMGNFNIRDNLWNPYYPHHSIHSDLLIDITDSLFLGLSSSTNCIPTRYLNNN